MSTNNIEISEGLELLDKPASIEHHDEPPEDPPLHVVIDRPNDQVRIRMKYAVAVYGAIGAVALVLFSITLMVLVICHKPTIVTVDRPVGTTYVPPIPVQPVSISLSDLRRAGTNYVIIQSFDDEADANKLAQRVAVHGVACTVEKSLAGWSGKKTAYSVVGLSGFDSINPTNKEFTTYMDSLKSLKMDPKPYKWRGQQTALTSAQ